MSYTYLEDLALEIKKTNQLLESIKRSLEAITIRVPGVVPGMPTVVEEALNNRYKVFKLDLTIARNNERLGLSDMGIIAKSATVTRLDSSASWRRNDPQNDLEELSVGYHVSNFEISELFITNAAGTGYLTIVLEWRE